ncbi:MAG TPA: FAD-dependent oxidoreductase [Gemmatimonadaceae bacterium]|nr:FAD-dependent oxidoreductase [Gemmatimonadaceae bacterium]
MTLSRRSFLFASAALIGLRRKTNRPLAGGFADDNMSVGHRIRDAASWPTPSRVVRTPIVIVGAGIAGLSAGWRLLKRGHSDFVILELGDQAGGNARWGQNEVSAYPWAAHYVPVPGPNATLVRELFTDLGVLHNGVWEERALCFAPKERLFINGEWRPGLDSVIGLTGRDRAEFKRFDDEVLAARATGQFTIPMALGAPASSPLDTMSVTQWLAAKGFTSPALRWYLDYACRDDFGASASVTSAWAGLHYFAAREPEDPGPLTWPEGNGWIARALISRLESRLHRSSPVYHIAPGYRVFTPDTEYRAEAVIFAAPSFLASHIMDAPRASYEYSPWLVANLTLDRWPKETGVGPAWDNVIFNSPALGYVVATHQDLRTNIERTVWTYYRSFAEYTPAVARRMLAETSWRDWADSIFADLGEAHPDLRDCVSRIDIMRHAHAMVRPTVGFLGRPHPTGGTPRLVYANSDLSGVSLFEEAQFRGVAAADQVIAQL